jgi:ribosomal protein S18 acetylase RimI-like enzyme
MTDLLIAPGRPDDHEWCARLMASSDPWRILRRDYAACLARCASPELTLLVARRGEEPCGFVLVHPTGVAGSPYIATIATAHAVRGQGVGAALVDAAERLLPHARHIFLCVSSFNTRARALYERLGYAKVGEFPDYVISGASEILMHKRLVRP